MSAGGLGTLGAVALLGARTLRASRGRIDGREALVQLHEVGVRTVWLVTSGMAFFGAVLVTIANAQARRLVGDLSVLGPAYFELLVREFGPIVSALLVAARFGSSCAAELSAMTVNEQVDALELSAGDPLSDLVAPRLLAGVLAVPALCILGTAAASLSASLVAHFAFGVESWAFADARYVHWRDIASGLLKTFVCGAYIPLVAARKGLDARGGAAAVGEATTAGVVSAFLGCLILDFAISIGFRTVVP